MGHLGLGLAPVVALLSLVRAEDPLNSPLRCMEPPQWQVDGISPLLESRGKVTLVALLKASRGFCVTQAGSLNVLRNKLYNAGFADVNFYIINAGDPLSKMQVNRLLDQVDFPVLQEPTPNEIWGPLIGEKDDMLVFDRCGKLAFHLRLPYSDLIYPYVEATIKATYYGYDQCGCQLDNEAGKNEEKFMLTEFETMKTETAEVETVIETNKDDSALARTVNVDPDSALIHKRSVNTNIKIKK